MYEIYFRNFLGHSGVTFAKNVDRNLRQPPLLNQNFLDRYQNTFCVNSLCDATGICLFCYERGIHLFLQNNSYFCVFKYETKRSNKRSGTRLKTERETVERRYHRPSVLFLLPHTPYDSYATLYRFLY